MYYYLIAEFYTRGGLLVKTKAVRVNNESWRCSCDFNYWQYCMHPLGLLFLSASSASPQLRIQASHQGIVQLVLRVSVCVCACVGVREVLKASEERAGGNYHPPPKLSLDTLLLAGAREAIAMMMIVLRN